MMCSRRFRLALAGLAFTAAACNDSPLAPSSPSDPITAGYRSLITLTKTKFVAFGDSITLGFISRAPQSATTVDRVVNTLHLPPDPTKAYPFKLEALLSQRYTIQTITVTNDGSGGEHTREGLRRLPGVLDTRQPEVLLLLEGINGLLINGVEGTADDLRRMVLVALDRGVAVLLATLTPVSDARELQEPGEQAAIRDLNQRIASLAAELDLGRAVDLYAAFDNDPSLLSPDGKHPSEAGYTRMAETFLEAIVVRFQQGTSPPSS